MSEGRGLKGCSKASDASLDSIGSSWLSDVAIVVEWFLADLTQDASSPLDFADFDRIDHEKAFRLTRRVRSCIHADC